MLLLINLIAGAFVGYVTKTLAINMLFRRYPIIGGAKIIDDREQLEIAMSTLVEERLIKPDTLLQEFQKEEFKETFETLIDAIVQQTIAQNIRHLDTVSGLQGFEGTLENLRGFLLEQRDQILLPAEDLLLKQLQVPDLLSPEQLHHLVRQLLFVASASLYKHRHQLGESLAFEARDLDWQALLPDSLCHALIDQLLPADIGTRLQRDWGEELGQIGDELVALLLPDEFLAELEASLKQRSLAELLGEWAHSDALQALFERLRQLFNSEHGRQLLYQLLDHLLKLLRELDIPLSALLTTHIEKSLLGFIQRHMPELILQLEAWIGINRREMETMINSAIEEHLASEGLVKLLLGNIFVQKLAERYQIVETTLRELKEMAHQSGHNLIPLMNRLLNHTRISDLTRLAEDYLLDREALIEVLLELINVYFPRLHLTAADSLLQVKLGEIPGIGELDLSLLFKQDLYPALREAFFKQWLESPETLSRLRQELLSTLQNLRAQAGQQRFDSPWLKGLQSLVLAWLNRPQVQELLIQRVAAEIRPLFADQSLNLLIDDGIRAELHQQLGKLYGRKLDEFLGRVEQEKIVNLYRLSAQIYRELCQNRQFPKQLADTLVGLMVKLIGEHRLLDGKIFVAVKESFQRFSNEELKDEMESFMGEELQPIKLLGAFLGAGVGVIMWWLAMIPGYSSYVTGYWALLSYSAAYALSEVGTNWMAIKMLFRPYQRKTFLGLIPLPFTPGIFPKNKAALAESMVNFIDKKLLAKDNMVRILEKYHPKWKTVIKEVISQNDYAVVDQTITRYTQDNYDSLAPDLLRIGFDEVNRNREEIAHYLLAELKAFRPDSEDLGKLQLQLERRLFDSREALSEWLIQNFYRLRQDDTRLMQRLPADTRQILEHAVQAGLQHLYTQSQTLLSTGQLPGNLARRLPPLVQAMMAQQLSQLLPADVLSQIRNLLVKWLSGQLQNPNWHERVLALLASQVLNRGISSGLRIGELWEGRLIQAAIQESDVIIKALSDYILKLSQNQKAAITQLILAEVEKKGLVESVMVIFGGVGHDVRGVVDVIVDSKLPDYLQNKQQELKDFFQIYLEQHLSQIRLSDLGLHEQVFDLNTIRSILQERILNQPQLIQLLEQLMSQVLDVIFEQLALQDMLSMLDLDSLDQMIQRFEPELLLARSSLARQLESDHSSLMSLLERLQQLFLRLLVYDRSARELLGSLPAPVAERWLRTNLRRLYESASFTKASQLLLGDLLSLAQDDITGFVDEVILQRDLAILLDSLTAPTALSYRSRHFQLDLQNMLRPMTLKFIEVLNSHLEQDTKQAIEDILVNSLVDSLRINNREVLEPIAFDEIVRAEVQRMEPERIEAMFDFAKPIFRLLIWYGALGGLIGLAVAFFEVARMGH